MDVTSSSLGECSTDTTENCFDVPPVSHLKYLFVKKHIGKLNHIQEMPVSPCRSLSLRPFTGTQIAAGS